MGTEDVCGYEEMKADKDLRNMCKKENLKQLPNVPDLVACVINILSHLLDALDDEDAIMILSSHDRALRYLVESDSRNGYHISSTCTFFVESMHACYNRKCSKLGECF
jgi:vacuolar-type H+-ATPase subunit E/Vma4